MLTTGPKSAALRRGLKPAGEAMMSQRTSAGEKDAKSCEAGAPAASAMSQPAERACLSHKLRATSYELRVTSYKLRATSYEYQATT